MTFEQKKQIVIDNSFKVDCNINMNLKEAYEKGFNRGLSKAPKPKVEQPQGKWIECTKSGMPLTEYGRMTGEKWYGFKCSQCNFIYKGNALIESPFFLYFGATMIGTPEEEPNTDWDTDEPQDSEEETDDTEPTGIIDQTDGIADPTYINGIVDSSDFGIFPWGNS